MRISAVTLQLIESFYIFSKKPKKNLNAAKAKTDKMQGSMATTTKLVKSIFDLMFKEQIDEDDTNQGGGGRRRRCGNCDVSIKQSGSILSHSINRRRRFKHV